MSRPPRLDPSYVPRFSPRKPKGKLPLALAVLVLVAVLVMGFNWLRASNWSVEEALQKIPDDLWNTVVLGQEPSKTVDNTGFELSRPQEYSTALAVLDTLPVHEKGSSAGYSREEFGNAWRDTDRNGCDQRNDILARDLNNTTVDSKCRVLSGVLDDPYTLDTVDFQRGDQTSSLVPVDHVVALSNAWVTGASKLNDVRRVQIATDPLNLQATTRSANTEKSDRDASDWLPQPGYRCEYVARQVSVKAAYGLWVTPAEKTAIHRVLSDCPEQPAYRSRFVG
ncbi:HNH endonuclease family protein [Rothia sp. ZJ1223]|uniref:HNH endonuclease family protein n=1 Tax=Rothia sp. ZJ1223 TaxID=2811098 RepID=UPI001EF61175|nr:HNH endonuclease family protein [Rothia sp. ZJ1223]